MVAECAYREPLYPGGPRVYAFEVPEGTRVGDVLWDRGQAVTVVQIGSDYSGPLRAIDASPSGALRE